MEAKYPARERTPEERAAMFQAAIAEAIVGSGVRKRKKSTARGIRTFGG